MCLQVDDMFEATKHDWFHKPAHLATLRKVCPNFKKAEMKYGHIHVPAKDVHSIFFDKNGYIHKELYHWKRALTGLRAFQLTMPHNLLQSAPSSHNLQPSAPSSHELLSGSQLDLRLSAPAHLERSTSAPEILLPDATEVEGEVQPAPEPAIDVSTRTQSNHHDELCPHLWVGSVPQCQANEACLRELFKPFGTVELVSFRNRPDKAPTNQPRSYAYITFGGTDAEAQKSVANALAQPVTCDNTAGETHTLTVQVAEQSKATTAHALNIWEQMSRVKVTRGVNLVPHSKVISSTSVEEAKMRLYEICFTAVIARYQEMEHSQLIGLKSLDR